MSRPWSPDEIELLRAMHAKGRSFRAIGMKLYRSRQSISGFCYREGLTSKRPPPTHEELERRRQARNENRRIKGGWS